MNKKNLVYILAAVVALLLVGVVYLIVNLNLQKAENEEMLELAELDKKEMESEYRQFADQYSEMKTKINNDSIVEQLTQEQLRTQQLLQELQNVRTTDAREIARLKKELATVRAVLRSYVLQIDSLNRLNQNLREENTQIRDQDDEATRRNEALTSEKNSLSEKVAIAAQLDATGIRMQMLNKKGKEAKKVQDCKSIAVSFTIARNVTAQNGVRTVYVRVQTPGGELLGQAGSFDYENRQLQSTMKKQIEYTGEEMGVTVYWNVTQFLEAGNYQVSIFADGKMIGNRTINFAK